MYDIKVIERLILKNNKGKRTASFEGVSKIIPVRKKGVFKRNNLMGKGTFSVVGCEGIKPKKGK